MLTKHGRSQPWSLVDSLTVESVTFGSAPPHFQFCYAQYDPAAHHLKFAMDARFTSRGLQIMLRAQTKPIGMLQPFTFRVEVTYLHVAGRLNLGLALSKEAPGIAGVHYSFQQVRPRRQ